MTASTLDVLVRARALIEKPENWVQRSFENVRGGIRCFCADGALQEVADYKNHGPYDAALLALFRAMEPRENSTDLSRASAGIWEFNDNAEHADVLAAFDRAIESERAKTGVA